METIVNGITSLSTLAAAHAWASVFVVLATLSAFAFNPKNKTIWPLSYINLSQPWRIVAVSGCTMAGVAVDTLTHASSFGAGLVTLMPWFGPAVGVLLAEIQYARKGEDIPPEAQILPMPPGVINVSSVQEAQRISAKKPPMPPKVPPLACLALFLLSGCMGSLEAGKTEGRALRLATATPVPPSGYCLGLDSQHRTWGGIAEASAFAAGASGLSTIPAEDDKLKVGLAIGSAVAGVLAAGAAYVSGDAASAWSRDCAGAP